jgi:hypothetical protein
VLGVLGLDQVVVVVDRRDRLVGRAHSGLVAGGLRRISKAEECKGEKLGNAMQCAAIGDRKAHLTLAIYFVMDESLGGLDEVCDEVPLTNWAGSRDLRVIGDK